MIIVSSYEAIKFHSRLLTQRLAQPLSLAVSIVTQVYVMVKQSHVVKWPLQQLRLRACTAHVNVLVAGYVLVAVLDHDE